MNFKIDENISPRAVRICQAAGHDAVTVTEEGLNSKGDPAVLAAATAEARMLITIDRRFGDIRSYPPGSHEGIVVLHPVTDDRQLILDLLDWFLAEADFAAIAGSVVVVEPNRFRIRRFSREAP